MMTSQKQLAETKFLDHFHVVLRLASQFLPKISFGPGDTILDIGCRSGKITEALATLNPDCQFTAITTSSIYMEAIGKDKTLQSIDNICFHEKDIYDLQFDQLFDSVVSFSCLTWFEDREKILKNIYQALKPGGKAYIQMFVDHGQDWFDECIFSVSNKPQWKNYFTHFEKRVHPIKSGAVLSQAERSGFIIQESTLQKHYVPIINEEYFKNWMMSWSPHLSYLPLEKVDAFYSEAVENYLNDYPKDKNGKIFYADYFLEVILLKPINSII